MIGISQDKIFKNVSNFKELIEASYQGSKNAVCWNRELQGDFAEIVNAIPFDGNMLVVTTEMLQELDLTKQGQIAREIILNDFKLLKEYGAQPILNLIKNYEKDDSYPFFPTDVYSFHVDRSPIPVDTFLCTYYGASSDILPNEEAEQKILIPEIRAVLRKLYDGPEAGFESFLSEYFFDLHYQVKPNANIINLGKGHLWKLATDNPDSKVLPCVHRAPIENKGEIRLLLIC